MTCRAIYTVRNINPAEQRLIRDNMLELKQRIFLQQLQDGLPYLSPLWLGFRAMERWCIFAANCSIFTPMPGSSAPAAPSFVRAA